MKDICRAVLAAAALILAPAGTVSAHIALSQPSFEAGQNYAAFFKVEQGCDGSPTIALNVQIPDGVIVLDAPSKPGWTVNAKRDKGQVTGVTWRGKLAAKDADQFGLFVKLPAKPGTLYFPVLQQCEKSEIRWSDIPAAGQASRDLAHPAAVLQLIAAAKPAPPHYMAGDIMIEQPWAPATPRGAATAVAYMTIMNHGSSADTLLGGTSSVGKLDIHQMSMANGIMSMRPVSGGVTIPPGGELGILKKQSDNLGTLLDYLPPQTIFLLCEPEQVDTRAEEYAAQVPPDDPFFISWEEFQDELREKGITTLEVKDTETEIEEVASNLRSAIETLEEVIIKLSH